MKNESGEREEAKGYRKEQNVDHETCNTKLKHITSIRRNIP